MKVGENLRWLSRTQWFVGWNADAGAAAREALAVLGQLPPGPQLAMAYSNQSQLRMLADDTDEAIAWGERAIALAEELGEHEILAHALNNVGSARLLGGDERGRAELERSLHLALADGFDEHVARAYCNLVSVTVKQYQFASADPYIADGIGYCLERDLDSWRFYIQGWWVAARFYRGRWDEAARRPRRRVRARRRVGPGDPDGRTPAHGTGGHRAGGSGLAGG